MTTADEFRDLVARNRRDKTLEKHRRMFEKELAVAREKAEQGRDVHYFEAYFRNSVDADEFVGLYEAEGFVANHRRKVCCDGFERYGVTIEW